MRIATAMAMAVLMAGGIAPLAGHAATPAGAESDAIKQFSRASEALYTKVSASVIHVKLEHNPAAMLPDEMRKEFENWLQQQTPGGGGGGGPRRPLREKMTEARVRPTAGADATSGPSTQPATGFGGMRRDGMLRRFLQEKAGGASDPDSAARYRRLLAGLDAVRGVLATEALGVVIDNDGNAIVLGSGLRESSKDKPLAVTGPDGKETTATYVGSHVARGLTVIKLDSPSAAPPLDLAEAKPDTGELLMCMTGSSSAVGWITVPGRGSKHADDRFAVYGADDRGAIYLFNTAGQLSAVGFDRFALPVSMLKENIHWIIENQQDLKPRQLGLKYTLLPGDSPIRSSNPVVGKNPWVVVVDEVVKGSAAERAGLLKGDLLVKIDRRPLLQIGQILSDLATRTGNVPLEVVRDNKPVTLEMPLDQQK